MPVDVDALAELCRRLDTAKSHHDAIDHATLASDRQRLRELGELAHRYGGTGLMLQIVYMASWSYRNTINTTNLHWQGIGDWQRQ